MQSMLWVLASLMAVVVVVVRAEYAPVYVFPDSNVSQACTAKEWNEVLQIMGNATTSEDYRRERRRRLGAPPPQRRLACPRWCGKYCAAMGVGCGQYGRRRQLQNGNDDSDDSNDDYEPNEENEQCSEQISAIDGALKKLKDVSPSCQSLVQGERNVSCPYFTTECYIHSIGLWNATGSTTPKVLIPSMNATGHVLSAKDEVAFLIETSFAVGEVTATLHYARSPKWTPRPVRFYNGYAAPYYAYGTQMETSLRGIKLRAGWYTLTVTSDDSVKSVSFVVSW
jgi:hypothetical protein